MAKIFYLLFPFAWWAEWQNRGCNATRGNNRQQATPFLPSSPSARSLLFPCSFSVDCCDQLRESVLSSATAAAVTSFRGCVASLAALFRHLPPDLFLPPHEARHQCEKSFGGHAHPMLVTCGMEKSRPLFRRGQTRNWVSRANQIVGKVTI